MARDILQIIIDATVKGKRDVDALNDSLGKAANKALPSAKSALMSFAKDMGIAGLAIAGVAAAAKVTWDALGQGAELEAARGRFDNLAASINTTGDAMLGTLREATKGMMSDAELVASATDIISLGLAGSEEDVARLATVIGTLGLDMQQVIMTFANNSTMRLDALGLSVETVTEKAKELEAQGFQGDAFDEAVLIALEEKMTLLGDASETTAGSMQRFEASLKNMKDAALLSAAAAFEAAEGVDQLNLMASTANYNQIAGDLRNYGYSWREVNKYVTDVENDFDLFRTKEEKMQQQLMAQQGITRATIALQILADGFKGTAAELGALVEQELINQQKAAYYAAGQDRVSTAYGDRQEAAIKAAAAAELLGSADDVLVMKIYDQVTAIDFLIEKSNEFSETLDFLSIRQEEASDRADDAALNHDKLMRAYEDAGHQAGALAGRNAEVAGSLNAVVGGLDDVNGRRAEASVQVNGLDSALSKIQALRTELAKGLGPFSDPYGTNDKAEDSRSDGSSSSKGGSTANDGARAYGGPVSPFGSYLVGEMGPEMFVPATAGNIIPNGQLGGGHTINIYVSGGGRGAQQQAQQIATAVTDALGRLN